ncbi:lactosylceramide 1,3-N-acetyl-beta-D-glucosaminyltransferase-like [Dermatophagoides pteronyssinus]|uniref:lactosylceramide 1,3-N-acetyl-beta-D-glucosaminyltransferase-like n=1 Tax=Dermatophagoides pteronyssinus TaxID=6956 RepID=UPI003F6755F1
MILNRNYKILINNLEKCSDLQNNTINFLIIILSSVKNFDQRQTIRETWALDLLQQLGNYRVMFMVGLTESNETQERLKFESLIHEDIVQINIVDSFYNLTYKSIHMLYWHQNYCPNAQYLIKTDDDIYFHIPNVIKWLKTIGNVSGNHSSNHNSNNTIFCHRNISRKILRNANIKDLFLYSSFGRQNNDKQLIERSRKKFQKYIVEYKQLPGNLYPEYCSGFAYAINKLNVEKLFKASKTIPYIGIEDVFITGFCREKMNITITDIKQFRLNPIVRPIESRCIFDQSDRITSNELTEHDMKIMWTHVNTKGYYCKFSSNITQNT